MNIFNSVKKAEIHVHLEATITPELCKKFAKRNNHEIPEEMFGSKYAYQWDDFYAVSYTHLTLPTKRIV